MADEIDEEFEVEPDELDEDLDGEELDEEFEDDDDEAVAADDDVVVDDEEEEDDEEEAEIPTRRKRAAASDDDEDDDEDDEDDDVEEDLDTILKDRIASGDDLEDEEEEEVPDRNDPEASDGVVAKKEGEFTCPGCFMIVHPRQFGRRDNMTCPEGYDPCPAMDVVRSMG